MKLKKISLDEVAKAELNEKEMLRLMGGGTPGCCQCGCNYEGAGGGSSTSDNRSANDAHGLTSDGSHPCCEPQEPTRPEHDVTTPPGDSTFTRCSFAFC